LIITFSHFEDYFDLFGIQKEPRINIKELTKRFRNVQSQIHPDKFSTKTQEEQTLSSEWSSLVNKAYKTLQSPWKRGEYLLSLRGIILSEDSKTDDGEFLMEMMEKNEAVSCLPLPFMLI
jgi:Fe-S protein assembly co-chaperone HscB